MVSAAAIFLILLMIFTLVNDTKGMIVPHSSHHFKNLGIKHDVIEIINTWTRKFSSKHDKFERIVEAENGKVLRQVISLSKTTSDPNWSRVVSRDFLKRDRQKCAFLLSNAIK